MGVETYYGINACRTIQSNSVVWAGCRAGAALKILPSRLAPNYLLDADTLETVSWWIRRPFMTFNTLAIPAGAAIVAGKLSIYVIFHTLPVVDLNITKSVHGEPALLSDWATQNPLTTIGGQLKYADMLDNQYNEIDLNADGLSWINAAAGEKNQQESFDSGENADYRCFDTNWWCMSFTPEAAHKIKGVKLKMWRKGNPGTLTVSIKAADASHFPTGPVLCSGTIDGNSLTPATPGQWYEIDLGAGDDLAALTEVTIEMKVPGGSVDNEVQFRGDSAGEYTGGQPAYSLNSGVDWVAQAAPDIYFIEYDDQTVGGTKLCLRSTPDISDIEPGPLFDARADFYTPQKGSDRAPKLILTLSAGFGGNPSAVLVMNNFI